MVRLSLAERGGRIGPSFGRRVSRRPNEGGQAKRGSSVRGRDVLVEGRREDLDRYQKGERAARADSARQIERRVRHATGGEPGSLQADGNHGRAGGYHIGMGRHGGTGGDAPARAIHWSAGLPGFEGAESLASPGVLHRVGWLDHSRVAQASPRRAAETPLR
ncbi:MAG: hypothetical protein OXE96_12650, partial [Gemmatimonadetes bacterium]|nr:hypothetical protein [Gemmatimonadota bacterium]